MKKIFIYLFFIITFFTNICFAEGEIKLGDDTIKKGILEGVNKDIIINGADKGKVGLSGIFAYTRDTIFALLALIVIGTFLFIGYKIVMSRGNPEEFKKSFMMLIYAIIGLLIVSLSWVIVMFIAGLNL